MTYVEVRDADCQEGPRTLDVLLDGPMKRLFDICDETEGVRGAARVMEFARGPVARFKHRYALSEQEARQVDDMVMAELERRFGWRGSDGRYLIDVYLGYRDHNC